MLPDYMKPQLNAEFKKLEQEKHNALNLGIDYINLILKLSREGVAPPHFSIAFTMLDRGTSDDIDNFESLIQQRQGWEATSLFDSNAARKNVEQELQGYVDVTVMLLFICVAINNQITQKSGNPFQHVRQIPQVHSLPEFSEESALKFVHEYGDEILEELEGTKVDFENVLNKITARAKNNTRLTQMDLFTIGQGLSPTERTVNPGWFYYRGALTAQDTYVLYHKLFRGVLASLWRYGT